MIDHKKIRGRLERFPTATGFPQAVQDCIHLADCCKKFFFEVPAFITKKTQQD